MIYTTYFAKLKSLPSHIVPISICAKAPDWYEGLQYKKLAPSYNLLMEYKKNYDKDHYIERFQKEVLDTLNPLEVVKDLCMLVGNFKGYNYMPDAALVCYEKSTDFCHRHLVADWLKKNGFEVMEYNK